MKLNNSLERVSYWIIAIVIALAFDLFWAFPLMYAWNHTMTYLFVLPEINWLHSFLLLFVLESLWKHRVFTVTMEEPR